MVFKKIIFQNRYVALETPSRPPPPFMANTILNFHFDCLNPSLIEILVPQPPRTPTCSFAVVNKRRAFTFLECSKIQEEVAEELGVSVRTIQRLSVKAKEHSLNRHQWGYFFPLSSSSSWVSNLPASSSQARSSPAG